MKSVLAVVFCICSFLCTPSVAQQVGNRVILIERPIGIPAHPSPGNNAVSHRFPGNTAVDVIAIDNATGWFEVTDGNGATGWIIKNYIASVVEGRPSPPADQCYQVGTWNLEHFKRGKERGFPESASGGPTLDPRTPAQVAAIAAAIRDQLKIRVLVLNEINGEQREVDGAMVPRSVELDELIAHLGPTFTYLIGASGSSQRVAFVWDKRFADLEVATEIAIPRTEVDGADIFARDPLVGLFSFFVQGVRQNDFVLVGLHLASGQDRTKNHDAAMKLLRGQLAQLRTAGTVVPINEHDVVLAGDLNASNFDNKHEQFFEDMSTGEWAVLAGNPYPPTRLAGVPLSPKSQIDYIIVSRADAGQHGLLGEEISSAEAAVHQELADGDWEEFRRTFSDHFPITTCIAVGADND